MSAGGSQVEEKYFLMKKNQNFSNKHWTDSKPRSLDNCAYNGEPVLHRETVGERTVTLRSLCLMSRGNYIL